MLLAGEIVYRYGIMAVFVVVAACTLAFLAAYLTRVTIIKYELIPANDRFLPFMRSLWDLEYQILNLFSAFIIFNIVFRLDTYLTVFLITVILLALFLYKIYEGTHINFVLISVLATVLPIFVFILKGVESVYHKLLYYHPRVLLFDDVTLGKIFIITFVIFFMKVLLVEQNTSKQRNSRFSRNALVVFILLAYVISFSTLNIVTVTEKIIFTNANELPLLLIRKLSPTVFYTLILSIALVSITVVFVTYVRKIIESDKQNYLPYVIVLIVLPNMVITTAFYEEFSMLMFYVSFSLVLAVLVIVYLIFSIIKNINKKLHKLAK